MSKYIITGLGKGTYDSNNPISKDNLLPIGGGSSGDSAGSGDNYYLSGGNFNNTTGDLLLNVTGTSDVTINLDGRYSTTDTTYTSGAGISLSGTVFSHASTSSQNSIDNAAGSVIQDIALDSFGHITSIGSTNLDTRYVQIGATIPWSTITGEPTTLSGYGITDAYNKTESDSRFFNVTGDTVTGDSIFNGSVNVRNGDFHFDSSNGLNVFRIGRYDTTEGSTNWVEQWVNDTEAHSYFLNDERHAYFVWTIDNTDTEANAGAQANTHTFRFEGDEFGGRLLVDGQKMATESWVTSQGYITSYTDTTYTAGAGLNLSGTEFSANFGTTAGTIAEGNHTHNYDNYQNWGLKINGGAATLINSGNAVDFVAGSNITLSQTGGQITINSTASGGTSFNAGTGLSFSGSDLNVDFGTTAGTVAQGNDSRINNGQTAFGWGDHSTAGYLTSETYRDYGLGRGAMSITDLTTTDTNDARFFRFLSSATGSGGNSGGAISLPYDGTPSTGILATNNLNLYIGFKNGATATPTWTEAWTFDNFNPSNKAETTTTISAGTGLSGGGNLGANRTLSFDTTWGDARYLPLAGGDMSGKIRFVTSNTNNGFEWVVNSDSAGINFKNEGDSDTNSNFNFFTKDNGNEYFKFSHQHFQNGNTDYMDIKDGVIRINGDLYINATQSGDASLGTNALTGGSIVASQSWVTSQGYVTTDTNTTYTAGTGLNLSGTEFSTNFGTTAGTVAEGNHTHNYDNYGSWNLKTNGVQRTTVQSGGTLDLVAGSNVSLSYGAGGVVTINSTDTNTNTTYSAGTGLSLSGTQFSVSYGTTAGTAAQGNDSRINNGQTAYGWGNHATAGYLTSYTDTNYYVNGLTFSSGTLTASVNGTTNRSVSLDGRYLPFTGGTMSGDISITKNNAWLTLDSSSAGGSGTEQGAGISIGESGYKGAAALHMTYTGDGYAHIGMGTVNATTNLPAEKAMELFYQSNVVKFLATPNVNGTNVSLDGHTHNYDNYGSWNLGANASYTPIGSGANVNFTGSGATSVSRSGNTITITSTDTNTNTNYYVNGLTFSSGTLTATLSGTTNRSVNLDGRYLELTGGTVTGAIETYRGIHGGYGNGVAGSADWGSTIWGMGSSYSANGQGTSFAFATDDYGLFWLRNSKAGVNTTANEGLYVRRNGVTIAAIGYSAAVFDRSIYADSFVEGSLRKLKENIEPFKKSGLTLTNHLDIVTFDKKDGKAKNKVGIIADDSPDEFLNEERTAVDLYKTTFVQAKAIQELSEKVDSQQKEINELKELVNKLLNK